MTEIRSVYADDEIELIDILKIVWKWKRFIVISTLLCAVAAGGISFLLPKVYRISMVIRPGIVGVDGKGVNLYIDSQENIKAIIEAGTFDYRILKALSTAYPENNVRQIKWSVMLPDKTNTLKVSYDTDATDQGIFILNALYKNLEGYYQPQVDKYKREYQLQVQVVNNDISKLQTDIASKKAQLGNDQARVLEIDKEIERISGNTNDLIAERNVFLKRTKKDYSPLSAVLYSNTIQQNISYLDTLKSQKTTLLNTISSEKAAIERTDHDIKMDRDKIKNIEFQANSVQNIQELQQPVRSVYAVRPKKLLNVVLAFTIGLIIMIFAAFFMEYIRKASINGRLSDD